MQSLCCDEYLASNETDLMEEEVNHMLCTLGETSFFEFCGASVNDFMGAELKVSKLFGGFNMVGEF
jgi:hypothetical protein